MYSYRYDCTYCVFLIISDLGIFFPPSDARRAIPRPKIGSGSFGHRARVQQPERARNQHPGRLPGRQPARARIQPKSLRTSSQISEFRSCMHSVSWIHQGKTLFPWIHARAGGWVAAHAMVWSRLPGRRALPIRFEKPPARKLKCARRLRSLASALARARGSEVTQYYWASRGVRKSEIIRKAQ